MMNITEFLELYPDEYSCVKKLFDIYYGDDYFCPRCRRSGLFKPVNYTRIYFCNCGYQLPVTRNTFMFKSNLPLKDWFLAMYLYKRDPKMTISSLSKRIEVVHKTAQRMKLLISCAVLTGDLPNIF